MKLERWGDSDSDEMGAQIAHFRFTVMKMKESSQWWQANEMFRISESHPYVGVRVSAAGEGEPAGGRGRAEQPRPRPRPGDRGAADQRAAALLAPAADPRQDRAPALPPRTR